MQALCLFQTIIFYPTNYTEYSQHQKSNWIPSQVWKGSLCRKPTVEQREQEEQHKHWWETI